MLKTLVIIFYLAAPQHSKASSFNQEAIKPKVTTAQESLQNATTLANHSLSLFKEKEGSSALLSIEKSLYLNPFDIKAHSLRKRILDSLSFNHEEIPLYIYLTDTLPMPLLLILFFLSFIFLIKSLINTLNTERESLNQSTELRIQTSLKATLPLFLILIMTLKLHLHSQLWACTNTETPFHTGPEKNLPTLYTKSAGSCHKVLQINRTKWASLKSKEGLPGWVETINLNFVRGHSN